MVGQVLRNRVRELRKAADMTLDDLAIAAGVGTTAIKAVEGGHQPTPSVQSKLAAALGQRVPDVFFWAEASEVVDAEPVTEAIAS